MPLQLFDSDTIPQALSKGGKPLPLFQKSIKEANKQLKTLFDQGRDVNELVRARARHIDHILQQAWKLKIPSNSDTSLIAVGGYGRGELHPSSDIDLLILLEAENSPTLLEALGELVTFFWDIGLEIGHSVRTFNECVKEAKQDITTATNLMESRLLAGPADPLDRLKHATGPGEIWPSVAFFKAKWKEQKQRYKKYDDTVSSLEPNIKESPGGMRDIQMIGWVVKRHFGAATMHDLVSHDFLTEEEFQDLMDAQTFLWQVRFALHLLTGRHEDRLLFDYQHTLAEQFGHVADKQQLGVEKFMQQYYLTALRVSRMNEMLLQLFQEVILLKSHLDPPKPIGRHFQSRSGFLEVVNEDTFEKQPLALLELFWVMQQHPELQGVRASTIRQARSCRHLIDDDFRNNPQAQEVFMSIIHGPSGISHELRRMNRYGILARYIPAFANIVGRMQYDLFHIYTVDEHTLIVIRNLRRFCVPEWRSTFPLLNDIMARLPKRELLFLAGLFHDIAKGRGGNHSLLGAEDAWNFAQQHGLEESECKLVAWLVKYHLLMSITAQRKDISDPEVISEFAAEVGDMVQLDCLYLLTVADMTATDPKKWNSWKNSLLRELYLNTKYALLRGLNNPQEQSEVVQNKQAGARHLLKSDGIDIERVNAHWAILSLDYFLHHTWGEIAWQTRMALTTKTDKLPLVIVRKSNTRGGTEVFLYSRDQDYFFALTTSLLVQLGLNIVSARIETTDTGYTLNSFLVLEESGEAVIDAPRQDEITRILRQALVSPKTADAVVNRRIPRQLKHFSIPTRIDFALDANNLRTIMKLETDDRPGLLSQVGYAFVDCKIRLINAKIATIGAKVEDTFFITDRENRPISEPSQLQCIEKSIHERIDQIV
ncbi:MAG: [protein-PII] uridylyltransferase [Candidatus Sedimenticola sp. (ex Thyasira tokunagai)]